MIRVVIDTNNLLRMAAGGERSLLLWLWQAHRFDLVLSLATLTELRTVVSRSQVQTFVPPPVGDDFLNLVVKRALFVQPDLAALTCRDPQDSTLIATAVGGHVQFLVTADPDLLDDPTLIEALLQLGTRVVRAAELPERLPVE